MQNVKLGQLIELFDYKRKPLSKMQRIKYSGSIPYYGAAGIIDYVNDYLFEGEYILLAEDGTVKTNSNNPVLNLTKSNEKFWVSNHAHIFKSKNIEQKYLYYLLSTIDISRYITGAVQPKINQENLLNIDLIIHSNVNIRKHIINTIGSIDDLIEKNNEILNKFDVLEQRIFSYEMYGDKFNSLEQYTKFEKGKKPKTLTAGGNLYLTIDVLDGNDILFTNDEKVVLSNENDVLMVMDGASSGKVYIGFEGVVGSTLSLIHCKGINSYFLYIFLKNNFINIKDRNIGSAIPHANKNFILSLSIPSTKMSNEVYNNLLKYKIAVYKKIKYLKELKNKYLYKFFK